MSSSTQERPRRAGKLPTPESTTGISVYTGKANGSVVSARNGTTPRITAMKVQPQSKTAPIPEGFQPTTGSAASGLVSVKMLWSDILETFRQFPRSWIGSEHGKILICIDPANTGKFAVVNGAVYWNGVLLDTVLEKSLLNTGKDTE